MSNEKLKPIHRGEILLEEFLKPLGISQYRLAADISVPPRRINEIVLGKRSISPDTALRLSLYFGLSEQFWINLQTRFDLENEKDKPERPTGSGSAHLEGRLNFKHASYHCRSACGGLVGSSAQLLPRVNRGACQLPDREGASVFPKAVPVGRNLLTSVHVCAIHATSIFDNCRTRVGQKSFLPRNSWNTAKIRP